MTAEYAYDGSGAKVLVVGQLTDGTYLVQNIMTTQYDDEEPAEFSSGIERRISKIYKTPPTVVFAKEIVEQKNRLQQLEIQRANAYREINETRARIESIRASWAKFAALKNLELFINDRIAYLVTVDYSGIPKIQEGPGAKTIERANRDEWTARDLKLLVLYGRSQGDLHWHLNRYSDGSGGGEDVYPFATLAEAEEKAKEVLRATAANEKKWLSEDVLVALRKYELPEAEAYAVALKVQLTASLEKRLAEKRLELADLHARWEAALVLA